jgi:hypothetical protein
MQKSYQLSVSSARQVVYNDLQAFGMLICFTQFVYSDLTCGGNHARYHR